MTFTFTRKQNECKLQQLGEKQQSEHGPGAGHRRSPWAVLTLAFPLVKLVGGKAKRNDASKVPSPGPDTKKAPDKHTVLKILIKIRVMLNLGNQEVHTHSETSLNGA